MQNGEPVDGTGLYRFHQINARLTIPIPDQ